MNGINSYDYNPHTYWQNQGSITVAQSALAATARKNSDIIALADTKKVIVEIPDGAVTWAFRIRSNGSEDDDNVLQMYAACVKGMADLAHYSLVCQLTATQGAQLDTGSIYFADEIVAASEGWYDFTFLKEPATPADGISEYGLNTYGHNRFLFICSTLAATRVYIDSRQLP